MSHKLPIAVWIAALVLNSPLHAHRTEGLLQSALVDVQAEQVEVQIKLQLGHDIAAAFAALLDADHDGSVSEKERADWSQSFLQAQSIRLDERALPLALTSMQASPIAEMTTANHGHAEVRVVFAGRTAPLSAGSHLVEHGNRYEPIPSTYQAHGIVPKAPGIHIASHRRDEREQTITLQVESSLPPAAVEPPHDAGSSAAAWWTLVAIGLAGGVVHYVRNLLCHRPE